MEGVEQNFTGTIAEKKSKTKQLEDQQKDRPAVRCDGEKLKNCFLFRYLGSMFAADGSEEHDVTRRIGIAQTRAGKLRHVFGSKHIPMATKLRLYAAAVGSLFTYGSEAWALTEKVLRRLNGANSRLLSHFTNKSIPEEARAATTSYNLTLEVRKRRLCWLGHLLRVDEDRIVRKAIEEQHAMWMEGRKDNLLMDAPRGLSMDQLTALALEEKKTKWRDMVRQLC